MRIIVSCIVFALATVSVSGGQASALVSGASRTSATGGGGSFQPVVSADGRFVGFVSQANNLVSNDNLAPYLDVFLRDRIGGGITLVSVSTNGTGGGDDSSAGPSISADGRYMAFQSRAGNLATNDTNGLSDIFLRDVLAGTTTLVSRQLDGRTALGRASIAPLLSTNGRWLVFESTSTNLVADDTNSAADIFLFDRDTGVNSLVSVNAAGNGSRAGTNGWAHLTPDGRYVAFVNFSNIFSPSASHVFVRDAVGGTTTWASSNVAALLQFNYRGVAHPVLSADGSAVFFIALSTTMTNLCRYDLAADTTTFINTNVAVSPASPSADGRFVAYEREGQAHYWDAQTSNNVVFPYPPSNERPIRPVLSADGSKLCFLSDRGGLTPNPTNGFAQLFQRDLTAGTTVLISRDTNGAAAGDLAAVVPTMSADGNIVAFESASAAMVADDFNLASDVFARDVAAGTTALLSGRDAAKPSVTGVAAAMVFTNGISADGRYVLFGSFDNGLFPGDTNGTQDLFVRDTVSGTVEPVSIGPGGAFTNQLSILHGVLSAGGRHVAWVGAGASFSSLSTILWRDLDAALTRSVSEQPTSGTIGLSTAPAISADGRWVAFQTTKTAGGFVPGVTDANGGASDIILQDVLAGTNVLVSRNRLGNQTANGASSGAMFSPDGRWLAFLSAASDLTTNAPGGGAQLFARDLTTHTTLAVSATIPDVQLSSYSGGATFSRDSRWLAFSFNTPQVVAVFDLLSHTGGVERFSYVRSPSLSGDGRQIAMENRLNWKITLLDRQSGSMTQIGSNSLHSYYPVLSGNGRYLGFLSKGVDDPATLPPRPTPYLHNIARNVTMPLPVSLSGGGGNGATYLLQLALDDRTLVFASFASDLAGGDYNDRRDVFTLRLTGPDTDGDGLDDDFEWAFFNSLSRDGNSDFDADGHNDRDEMLAGTDPTNQGSVLRVLTLASVSAHSATVIWESVAGRHYEVQFKDDVAAGWSTLAGVVTATGASALKMDDTAPRPGHRLYRVRLLP